MKRGILTLLVTLTLVTGQQANACCLMPFFPAYAAGYPAWGGGYGWGGYPATYGYAPASYNYGYGNCGSCGSCNSCGGVSGGYVGYYGGSMGCCDTGCGSSCGNCVSQPFSSSKPSPDPAFDRRDDRDDDYNRDRTFRSPDRDRLDPMDDTGSDDFNSSTGRGGRSDSLDRDPIDRNSRDDEWDTFKNRDSSPFDSRSNSSEVRPDNDLLNNDFDYRNLDRGNPDDDMPNFSGSNRPVIDDPAATETPSGGDTIDQTVRKPPVTAPVEEEMPEEEPATTEPAAATEEAPTEPPAPADEASGTPAADDAVSDESPFEPKDGVDDFLAPEDSDNSAMRFLRFASKRFRSSHTDGLRMNRLAGRAPMHTISARKVSKVSSSRVSSSRREEAPARWISIPRPAGRVQL